jgi:hypothetical protein
VIVAMTAGPPPLPAGADLTPPLPRADSVPGQWVNATERPAVDAGVTLYVHGAWLPRTRFRPRSTTW